MEDAQDYAVCCSAFAVRCAQVRPRWLGMLLEAVEKFTGSGDELTTEETMAYHAAVAECTAFLDQIRLGNTGDPDFVASVVIYSAQGLAFVYESTM